MDDLKPRYSKRLRAGTRRRYHDDGISDEEIDGRRTFDLEEKVHSQKFNSERIKQMDGKAFTYEYVQRGGLRDPIIFEKPDGLGIKMPDPDFSVNDVKIFVGSRRMVDVVTVGTQKETEMSLAQWRRYYQTPPPLRDKLYNVISLEFSHTKMAPLVAPPRTVDLIDWVDNMWPRHLKERQRDSTNSINDMQYPKVQKYCLMSVQGCYTDFHIDFGGTSVWYHILRGSKVFWLMPPTQQNLELYENWVLSGKQGDVFLGDQTSDCQRIHLRQGHTFIIPSGWIHAVYTPVDSLVFGGNFLHSFNVPMQLHISAIEDRTRVPLKYRYPFYCEMGWYVLERYVYCLTHRSHLTAEYQRHSLGPVPEDTAKEGGEEEACSKPGVKVHLTPFELEGLWSLVGRLESLPPNKKSVPAGIANAPALLNQIKALLKDHANDVPKLSYTGKPIVSWPNRPAWYQPPPPPPPPPPRPKLSTNQVAARPQKPTSSMSANQVAPRPQKPASSMSVLRRRRVRCKRCEACMRAECGECNFCRDMKKFGGPGKLKQTCVLRQCLAPGLPLSAVCEVCKEPNQEETGDPSLTLMECSNCAQIVHPACLTVQGDGVINKDLPSCWECPKCVQGITDPEQPKGELKKQLPTKRKSSSLLDARIAKIYRRHRQSRDGDESASDEDDEVCRSRRMALAARGGGHTSRRGYGANRRGLWRGNCTQRGSRAGMATSGSALKLKRGAGLRGEREGVRRGRGVRLRGGIRMQRRREDSEESEEEDEEDDSEEGEHRHHRRRRRTDEEEEEEEEEDEEEDSDQELDPEEEMEAPDEEEEGQWDSDSEPPVLLVSDLSDDLLTGSYLTVTLQRPQQARTHSRSIVPKLEAAVATRPSRFKNPSSTTESRGRLRFRGGHHYGDSHHSASSSSEEEEETQGPQSSSALSPPPLLSLPSFRDAGDERGGEKEIWVAVFSFLTREELLTCMTVCKAWYKWSCDKRLWYRVDVSRCSPLSNSALAAIIKRQPRAVDLSWTPLAKKQLNCLLLRLPGLRELSLAGLPWSCLSALVSASLPCLRLLDLRWCDGIRDAQIKDIISPPGAEASRSRLRYLLTLRLAGLEVSEATVRLLQRHLPQLERLDLSHCPLLEDSDISLLATPSAHSTHTLTQLSLAGCNQLTDSCLSSLRRLTCLSLLDVRGCRNISRRGCDSFISDLSHIATFCLTEEQLIQRIT